MTIIPTIISAVISALLWFYIRTNIKRNFVNLFKLHPKWIYGFDFIFFYCGFFRFFYRLQNHKLDGAFFFVLINFSYILLGFLGLLTLMFLMMDFRNLIERLFHREDSYAVDSSRREFFKRNLAITGIATSTVITGVGFANSFDPKLKKVRIPLKAEHKNLHGLKIAQLSDIHIGPTLKKEFSEQIASIVNALDADIVVITGDMIDGRVEYLKEDLQPLTKLKSKMGTFFVTGNHEYYWMGDEWIEWTRSVGMKPLVNENIKLNFNGSDFYLAGVNDPTCRRVNKNDSSDPFQAAKGIPDHGYKILLAHQPASCFQAAKAGFQAQLSGHTHGGQGFPWNIIVNMVQPYVQGLNTHDGMHVYVHTGTGFWGPPNRFMVDSEIAEIVFTYDEVKT